MGTYPPSATHGARSYFKHSNIRIRKPALSSLMHVLLVGRSSVGWQVYGLVTNCLLFWDTFVCWGWVEWPGMTETRSAHLFIIVNSRLRETATSSESNRIDASGNFEGATWLLTRSESLNKCIATTDLNDFGSN